MKIIVGLGNPEGRYAKTRHNAGFMVVDRLLSRHAPREVLKARFNAATAETSIGGERCLLMKPTTYMNRSGLAVGEAVRFFKVDFKADLLVVVDELYIPTGKIRINPKGGAGGHNGLAHIQQSLGSDEYPRLRVGVGLQPDGGKPSFMDQSDFVLGQFAQDEEPLLAPALDRAAAASESFVTKGLAGAMNAFNGPEGGSTKSRPDPQKKESTGPGRPPQRGDQGPQPAA
ncbi:MAG: aminoacyl-tRNA hydrolase [Phycisphaerales bacterium]